MGSVIRQASSQALAPPYSPFHCGVAAERQGPAPCEPTIPSILSSHEP